MDRVEVRDKKETNIDSINISESREIEEITDEIEEELMVQFLLFHSGGDLYGINILQTHEVLKPILVKRIPNVEPDVLGVINLRGNIIPVIDINKKFGYKYSVLSPLSRIIICIHSNKMNGILVDRVLEVARISENGIEKREIEEISSSYIEGVGRYNKKVFLILNTAIIFKYEEES